MGHRWCTQPRSAALGTHRQSSEAPLPLPLQPTTTAARPAPAQLTSHSSAHHAMPLLSSTCSCSSTRRPAMGQASPNREGALGRRAKGRSGCAPSPKPRRSGCACVCVCVCVCVCAHTHVFLFECACVPVCVCMCTYVAAGMAMNGKLVTAQLACKHCSVRAAGSQELTKRIQRGGAVPNVQDRPRHRQ